MTRLKAWIGGQTVSGDLTHAGQTFLLERSLRDAACIDGPKVPVTYLIQLDVHTLPAQELCGLKGEDPGVEERVLSDKRRRQGYIERISRF